MPREFESRRIIPPPGIVLPSHLIYRFFDHSITFAPAGTGNDWEIALSNAYKLAGSYSCKVATKRTNPTANDVAYDTWYFSMLPFNVIDVSVDFLTIETDRKFFLVLSFVSNFISKTEYQQGQVAIALNTGKVYIYDKNGNPQLVETLGDIGYGKWVHVEMTIDLIEKKYKTIYIGTTLIDVSQWELGLGSGYYGSNAILYGVISENTGTRGILYIDNVVAKSHLA